MRDEARQPEGGPEQTPEPPPEPRQPLGTGCGRGGRSVLIASGVLLVVMVAQSLLLKYAGPWQPWAEITIAMAPVAAFAVMFWTMWRHVRELDEMQRRMQLEALGLTVIVASLICITIGQLQKIGVLEKTMLDDAWAIIAFTYVGAMLLTKLRYR